MSIFGNGDAFDFFVLTEASKKSKNQGGCMLSLISMLIIPVSITAVLIKVL